MAENIDKKKALETALSQIEKQFGKGSVMKLGDYKAMEISYKGKKDRYYCFRYAVVGYTERKGLNGNISK